MNPDEVQESCDPTFTPFEITDYALSEYIDSAYDMGIEHGKAYQKRFTNIGIDEVKRKENVKRVKDAYQEGASDLLTEIRIELKRYKFDDTITQELEAVFSEAIKRWHEPSIRQRVILPELRRK